MRGSIGKCGVLAAVWLLMGQKPVVGQTTPTEPTLGVDRLRDRGEGLPTSMFGTYVAKGQLIVYPFFEGYRDRNFEYKPSDFGATGDVDYRGRFHAREGLFFVGYGVSDRLAVEFEVATIRATFDKAPNDPGPTPTRLVESGVGDIEGQVRWRFQKESAARPEVFSYFEAVIPHHRQTFLIGTPGWELKAGAGVIRGFSWGTLTGRASLNYDQASTSHVDVGEYAVEYLKRLSKSWRVYAGIEGSAQDEVSFIGEVQWHFTSHAFLRINNGIGLTSKATDWSPELGVVFTFGPR